MNKSTKSLFKKIISLIIIAFLIWSVGAMYMYNHEEIHQKIFKRYQIDSNISINYFKLSGTTTPTSYDNCTDICKLSNSLNDIIGYNIALVIYFAIILVFIIFIIKKNE